MRGRLLLFVTITLLVIGSPAISQNDANVSNKENRIMEILENTRTSFQFSGEQQTENLQTAIDVFSRKLERELDANVVKRSAVSHVNSLPSHKRKVHLNVNNFPLKQLSERLLKPRGMTLSYNPNSNTVFIKPVNQVHKPFLKVYDIKDLTLKIADFPGPSLELKKPEGSGGKGGFLGPQFSEGGSSGNQNALSNSRRLKELIKNNTGTSDSWTNSEATKIKIKKATGIMLVNQTEQIQKEISNFLLRLRRYR